MEKRENMENQEIDLFTVFSKSGVLFEYINTLLFRIIRFLIKKSITIITLAILGMGIGAYLDYTQATYSNEIVVEPNFGSNDYLYAKINLLKSKIRDKDNAYLRKVVGIQEPENLIGIEIKPIVDIYQFIDENERYFDLVKLMSEENSLQRVINDSITSKNYIYHKIYLKSKSLANPQEVVNPLLNYLNTSDYYDKIKSIQVKNLQDEMIQNSNTITQINSILNNLSKSSSTGKDKLVYYNNENSQLNEVLKTKQELIETQGMNRVKLIKYDKIIKEISMILNEKKAGSLKNNLTKVLPAFFVILFILFRFFTAFYRKQALKEQGRV